MPMIACLAAGILTGATDRLSAANPALPLLNEPVDVSGDFRDFSNLYYLADQLADFDRPRFGQHYLSTREYFTRQAFDNMLAVIKPVGLNEFPTINTQPTQPAILHRICFAADGAHPPDQRPAGSQKFRGADAGRRRAAGPFLEIQQD